MSLLTRCPACITLYRVVPDQLRISDGWVKCGQCGEIFDASQHLVEEVFDPVPQSDVPLDTALAGDVPATQNFEDTLWMNAPANVPGAASNNDEVSESTQTPAPDPDKVSAAIAEVDFGLDVALPPEQNPALVPQAPDEAPAELAGGEQQADASPVSDQTPQRWDDETPPSPSDAIKLSAATLPDGAQVTFLKSTDRPSLWQKPMVRVVWMLFGLVLGLSLVGQWVYLERDRLAVQHPELKPALQAMCGVAACQVQALKHIESLSVDTVGFQLLGNDTYRLNFTIKNASVLPLALPNVELALTDASDQPVYRRVFSARDLPAASVQIAAGGEWPVAVALRVKPAVPDQRVLGYRLLIFYP